MYLGIFDEVKIDPEPEDLMIATYLSCDNCGIEENDIQRYSIQELSKQVVNLQTENNELIAEISDLRNYIVSSKIN